jgi:phosphoribosyl-ATP pyrophosphohydrolase
LNLRAYQDKVEELAEAKGYNQETFYLFSRMVQEASEMLDALWQEKSDEEFAEEGADLLHFFFQLINKRPNANIDRAMLLKISSNFENLKKTQGEDGKMMLK